MNEWWHILKITEDDLQLEFLMPFRSHGLTKTKTCQLGLRNGTLMRGFGFEMISLFGIVDLSVLFCLILPH